MRILLFLVILVAIVFGPQVWTKRIFAKYGTHRDDFPGTGGELARHLLDRMAMKHVAVEPTELGDHYDPLSKAVRLSPSNLNGKSLTAVTVAAHEVGHAIQDQAGYKPLSQRTNLIRIAQGAEKVGAVVMMGIPLVAGLTRSPAAGIAMLMAGIMTMGVGTLIHVVTLPVEWDASFRRALPILERGGYLKGDDLSNARRILTAAALTYVAASLASLLNLWRWIALLARR